MRLLDRFSIVIPMYNEESSVVDTYMRLRANTSALAKTVDLVFVDDGSNDGTLQELGSIAATDSNVKVVSLSRNFGHQIAVSAGLRYASGEATVIIDGDLQDPPELIGQFVSRFLEGYDVVYGIRQERQGESLFKRSSAKLFYWGINRIVDVPIPRDVGDFRLLSRRMVSVINQMPEGHRFIRGMVAWAGFKQIGIPYSRNPRLRGYSKYPLRKMWRLSIDALTSFSVAPLRLAARLGLMFGLIGFLSLGWILLGKLMAPSTSVRGWSSTIAVILTLGGLQLFVMGIFGEYLGRILEQVRGRPLYLVSQTYNLDKDYPVDLSDRRVQKIDDAARN